jgi:hypothetical protein
MASESGKLPPGRARGRDWTAHYHGRDYHHTHIYHTPGQTVTGAQARTGVAVSLSRTLLVLPASPSPDHIALETSNKPAANLDPDSLADSEVVLLPDSEP